MHLHDVAEPRALLVLGHGAGGGIAAPDLVTAARVASEDNVAVALVEQPYRVAGRRSPAPAAHLDAAWIAVVEALAPTVPLVAGGRSSGARVACRTAAATGASGVLCLAFPLISPKGVSRVDELDAVRVPTLVVQGMRDRFGMPPPSRNRKVVHVQSDHSLRTDLAAVANAIRVWLAKL